MNSNNNNNNKAKIKAYDNKCVSHKQSNIVLICSDCKEPVCLDCMVSETHHRGHKVDHINLENTTTIFEKFKTKDLPNLIKCLNGDKELENKSNTIFNKIDEDHTKDMEMVKNEFNQLRKIIDTVENDTLRQLLTNYDDNKEIHDKILLFIKDNTNNVNLLLDKYKNNIDKYNIEQIFNNANNNNNNNTLQQSQHIEILKHSHQSKILINDTDKDKKNELLQEYNYTIIKSNMSSIKDSIKTSYTISKQTSLPSHRDPKKVTVSGFGCYIYKDGVTIPHGTHYLALGANIKDKLQVGSIPHSVVRLVLLDGFNQQLSPNIIPRSVQFLFIGAIKQPLIQGSIPTSVNNLFFLDGFNQNITEYDNIIPNSNCSFYLGNTTFKIPVKVYQNYIFKSNNSKHNYDNYNQNNPMLFGHQANIGVFNQNDFIRIEY